MTSRGPTYASRPPRDDSVQGGKGKGRRRRFRALAAPPLPPKCREQGCGMDPNQHAGRASLRGSREREREKLPVGGSLAARWTRTRTPNRFPGRKPSGLESLRARGGGRVGLPWMQVCACYVHIAAMYTVAVSPCSGLLQDGGRLSLAASLQVSAGWGQAGGPRHGRNSTSGLSGRPVRPC